FDVAYDRTLPPIHHRDLVAVSDKDPVRGCVKRQIVPAVGYTERNRLGNAVTWRCLRERSIARVLRNRERTECAYSYSTQHRYPRNERHIQHCFFDGQFDERFPAT